MNLLKNCNEKIAKTQRENKIPQPSFEHTPSHHSIESNEGVIYDTELEINLRL